MALVDINNNIILLAKALLLYCYYVSNKNLQRFEASSLLPAVDSGILPVPGDAANETLCNGDVFPVTTSCLEVYSVWQRDSGPPSLLNTHLLSPGGLKARRVKAECLGTERSANLR